jgi:hypothetical protein
MLFAYDGPMKPFLLALRSQTIPAALIPFLYDIKPPVSFVDGCLVVEIQDMRKNPEVKSRVVMRPAAEALAQTVDVMLERRGQAGDERLALELESRIIVRLSPECFLILSEEKENVFNGLGCCTNDQSATSPPLYLGTSILATRNAVLSLSLTAPTQPDLSADGTHRSLSSMNHSSDSSEFERMRRLLRAGDTSRSSSSGGMGVPFQPTWSVLRAKARAEEIEREKAREKVEAQAAAAAAAAQGGYIGGGMGMGPGMGVMNADGTQGGPVPGGPGVEKKKTKKKRQADDEGGAEVKKPKKKKTAAAGAGAASGAGAGEGDKKVKIEPASTAPGTGAGAGAAASQDKPKKVKKKKAPVQAE